MTNTTRAKRKKEIWLLSVAMFVLLAFGIILGLYFREPWLWMDEVLSYVLISDPSPVHLNDAVVSSMDANPPLFPNLYWFIGHAMSLDPLFLRALSVVLFASTIALFYWYTTRLIGDPVINFVLISVMVYFTYQNFAHSTEIRSYAVLLPISCVYFIIMHWLINRPTSAWLLAGHTLVGMLMAFCHNYGLFYLAASGAFFLSLLIWSKQRNYALVLATYGLIGIVWLVVWYPSFSIQAYAGQPHSWIPLPTVSTFFSNVGDLIPSPLQRIEWRPWVWWMPMLRVIAVVGLFTCVVVPKLKMGFQAVRQDEAFQFLLLSGFVYLTVIIIAMTVTFTYTSVFISRYMWPSQLLIMFQLVYTYYHFAGPRRIVPRLAWLLPVYSLFLGILMFERVWKMQTPFQSQILEYLPQLSAPYPVFVERADYFLPIWFHKQRPNVSFLLDWKTADRPNNIKSATVDYKMLKSLKEKYKVGGIVEADQFNASHFPHFYVVDEQAIYQIEGFIKSGQIKVINELPIAMPGHRLLECAFSTNSGHLLNKPL